MQIGKFDTQVIPTYLGSFIVYPGVLKEVLMLYTFSAHPKIHGILMGIMTKKVKLLHIGHAQGKYLNISLKLLYASATLRNLLIMPSLF